MSDLTQSHLSKQYVCVPASATAFGAHIDPTALTVQMSFPATGVDASAWNAASWEDTGGAYLIKCLVGPSGTVTLAAGDYDVWVKVTDSPEVPAEKVGTLRIT